MRKTIGNSMIIGSSILVLMVNLPCEAQDIDNEFNSWIECNLNYDVSKHIRIHLAPELRLAEGFTLDKYLVDAGGRYEVLDFLKLGAGYRFIGNKTKSGNVEYFHRYAFDLSLEKKIKRFKPELRLRYSNYSDDELDKNYMRYQAEIKYDIQNCKLTPFISAEAFHNLSFSSLVKMRYRLGGNYKLFKNNSIKLYYQLDYYLNEYKNRHVLGISYRYNF